MSGTDELELIAVFAGECPARGARTHESRLLHSSGDAYLVARVASGQLSPLDDCIPLSSQEHDEQVWILLRPRMVVGPKSALVVEDNEVNRVYYSAVLEQLEIDVSTAETASEASDFVNNNSYDLILVDVRLPDANGFELCRSLTANTLPESTRVILMSADPKLADSQLVDEVGASGFIVNPIEPTSLSSRILDELSKADGARGDFTISLRDEPSSLVTTTPDPPQLAVKFFGTCQVFTGDEWIRVPSGRSTGLLASLAAACPAPVSSERLTRLVWPSSTNVSANAVYTGVSRLRSYLADVGLPDLVVTEGTGYRLDLEPNEIDLVRFESDAREALAVTEPLGRRIELLQASLDQWGGTPFPNAKNQLLTRWAQRLVETRSRLVEAVALSQFFAGHYGLASEAARDLLNDEPWRESTWTVLIASLYRAGRTNDALQTFATARSRLNDELGLEPGPILSQFELMILTHDPRLLDDEWIAETIGTSAR